MSGSSIGTIIGGVIGVILAPFTGGASLAVTSLLMAAGGAIGGMLDPPKGPHSQGQRLSDLQQQTSTYGAFIPRIYGTIAVYGNVFWLENNKLKEVATTTTQGGKGGTPESSVTTFKYYATFALGLCEGPIFGIGRIWISGKLWYNSKSDKEATMLESLDKETRFKVYYGSDDQIYNIRMQADKGIENIPHYHGLAYIVFFGMDVGPYGNSLAGMQIKVEVIKNGATDFVSNKKGESPTIEGAGAIGVLGNYVYVATGSKFRTYDATRRKSPVLINTITTGGIGNYNNVQMKIIGEHAYCPGENANKLDIFSLKNRKTPLLVSTISTVTNCWACDVVNDYLYVAIAGAIDEIKIYDISNKSSPVLIHTINSPGGRPYAVLASLNFLYVGRYGSDDFLIYDVSTKTAPVLKSTTLFGTRVDYLQKNDTNLIIAGIGKIQIYNIVDPSTPVLLSTIEKNYSKSILVLDNNLIVLKYITHGGDPADKHIDYYDITKPETPKLLKSLLVGQQDFTVGNKEQILNFNGYFYVSDVSSTKPNFYVIFASPKKVSVPPTLASIVEAECTRSNILTAADLDVTDLTQTVRGYKVGSVGSIRGALEPLQGAFPFDVVQTGYKIKFISRGGSSVATIPSTSLAAISEGESPGIQITKSREMDSILPQKVSIKYYDIVREYDNNEQYFERMSTESVNISDLEIAVVLTADEAAAIAQTLLYLYWKERYDITITLPPEYLYLEPSDVITVTSPEATYVLRLKQINYAADGRLEIQAKYHNSAIYTPLAVGDTSDEPDQELKRISTAVYELLDIPLVNDRFNFAGFAVAMSGSEEEWPGGVLYQANDTSNYSPIQGFSSPGTTWGYATNVIGIVPTALIDKASTLKVELFNGQLSSVSELQMLNGGNHFAYGADGRWEIIAAQNCVLQADGSYLFTDLLRGRFGTEIYTGTHIANDSIVFLETSNMQFIATSTNIIGAERNYKGLTSGMIIDESIPKKFTYNGINLECLSPVYLNGNRNPATKDWTLSFIRRTRMGGEWRDLVDASLSEAFESYEIDIYSDNTFTTVKRTLASTAQSVVYSVADQAIDFGGSIGGDNYYANRVLCLHFDGPDNSTTFVDNSPNPKSVTANGNTKISTAQSKFGNTSGYFDGSGDFLSVANHVDLSFGTSPFTISFWVYPTANNSILLAKTSNNTSFGSYELRIDSNSIVTMYLTSVTNNWNISFGSGSLSVTLNSWNHIELTWDGAFYRLFINGVNSSSISSSTPLISNAENLSIGAYNNNVVNFTGYLDEIYIWKGVALHISDFTPPNNPFSDFQSVDLTTLNVKVYQMSDIVGRGYPLTETITR